MFEFLDSLFLPGRGRMTRTPNRLKAGYLKKSSLFHFPKGWSESGKQGDREKARRLRQKARKIIVA